MCVQDERGGWLVSVAADRSLGFERRRQRCSCFPVCFVWSFFFSFPWVNFLVRTSSSNLAQVPGG